MVKARQREYARILTWLAVGYEDCNDADLLRINPALSLAIVKDQQVDAGQSRGNITS